MSSIPARPARDDAAASRRRAAWLVVGLVVVALNLRPALSSVAPVLASIQSSLGLSAAQAGLLTTLPVLCLGLFAPLAPRLAARFDAERAVFAVLFVLAAGTALRGLFGTPGLFAGALLAGGAIGVIGVLLPGIVKREFPERASLMMGLYTMSLCLGAATAAGLTVPLRDAFGDWRPALAAWGALALVAAFVWWPQLKGHTRVHPPSGPAARLWRSPLAWAVTFYMGLQSSLAYIVFGWLPPILVDRGASPLEAGFMMSVSVLVQLVTAFTGPALATRLGHDQRPTLWLMLALALVGIFGCLYAPLSTVWLWVVFLGLGQGGQFSVAMLLIVLRSGDATTAARLSGMSQGVGYTLAAMGPLAVGVLHDLTGGWDAVGVLFALVTLAAAAAGWLGGQRRVIGGP
ncbi:MAG TPA: CynX/NimT family MFS transporter [Burkholderiaceae bacterium]|nr:CynX/NimT family MFS transporter [Burkholderiaceae bacterium]